MVENWDLCMEAHMNIKPASILWSFACLVKVKNVNYTNFNPTRWRLWNEMLGVFGERKVCPSYTSFIILTGRSTLRFVFVTTPFRGHLRSFKDRKIWSNWTQNSVIPDGNKCKNNFFLSNWGLPILESSWNAELKSG